jgi:putative phosphoesterase
MRFVDFGTESICDEGLPRVLIGILSDTHDQTQRTKTAVAALLAAGAEALIHCGDITIADVVYECCKVPSYFVFGNCDFDRESLRQAMALIGGTCLERGGLITLAGRRIAITHGDSDQEIRRLTALQPDYLFSGHTHRSSDVKKGPTRHINPGALHRASTWTIGILNLATNHLTVLPIINDSMQR